MNSEYYCLMTLMSYSVQCSTVQHSYVLMYIQNIHICILWTVVFTVHASRLLRTGYGLVL